MEVSIDQLKKVVETLHNCKSEYIDTLEVEESFQDKLVWKGSVLIFKVDHAATDTCYAWSSPVEGSDNRKFYAVLKTPPVETAQDAVRASIISDYRE